MSRPILDAVPRANGADAWVRSHTLGFASMLLVSNILGARPYQGPGSEARSGIWQAVTSKKHVRVDPPWAAPLCRSPSGQMSAGRSATGHEHRRPGEAGSRYGEPAQAEVR